MGKVITLPKPPDGKSKCAVCEDREDWIDMFECVSCFREVCRWCGNRTMTMCLDCEAAMAALTRVEEVKG